MGLFLSSTVKILDFLITFLSTLSALNDLHKYDFVMIIMRHFGATKQSPKRSFHVYITKIPIQNFF